ncbi:MAG: hypothetical protein LPH21_19040, partial [Shewanella sp.]|nr:hypothetical protein [Shewanella sp.]
QEVAKLREMGERNNRGRIHLSKEFGELEDRVEGVEKQLLSLNETISRLGGTHKHEEDHRFLEMLIRKHADRKEVWKKVKQDLFSKTTVWLLVTISAALIYVLRTAPNILTGVTTP